MDADSSNVLKLFERIYENTTIDDGRRPITFPGAAPGIATRFGGGGVPPIPGLGRATTIPMGVPFSSFYRPHRLAAIDLCRYLDRATSVREFASLAQRVRGQVNEMMFIYAMSYVILRKPALRGMGIPSVVETFPCKFVQQDMIAKGQNRANNMGPNQRETITVDQEFAGTIIKAEHRVSYWREDYGLNSHHWHWHLVFPVELDVVRDRKGELFFYMHQQMLARYDMERLSVGLNRVVPLNSFREPIPDGYFSKLTINNAGLAWGTRQDDSTLKDVRREPFDAISLNELESWYNRVLDAVHLGYMLHRDGSRVPISDDVLTNGKRGIDILGDAFEADPELSVNFPYYGDMHNLSHVLISYAHDPDNAHREENGVMGDSATAMRDPVFYRLHKFVDNLFQTYKLQQTPYTLEDLNLAGIKVDRIGVLQGADPNILLTGWNTRLFEASRGLDFNSLSSVNLRIVHLDHRPFNYHLLITNNLAQDKVVTVRIFLAPKFDERGQPLAYMEQRLLWAEMDKFTENLKPGQNQIVRASMDSSITGPEERTFRQLETGVELPEPGTDAGRALGECGCGWPQHLLVPRGLPQGMEFQLFVMLSDWDKDRVEQGPLNRTCSSAVSYCGIRDAKFPDGRPMGFPFDRRQPPRVGETDIVTAGDFAGAFENMLMSDITIRFTNAMLE